MNSTKKKLHTFKKPKYTNKNCVQNKLLKTKKMSFFVYNNKKHLKMLLRV